MVALRQNARLVEEFEDIDYSLYTCNQSTTDDQNMGRTPGTVLNFGLNTQRHIDIRTFSPPGWKPTNIVPNGGFEGDIATWQAYTTGGLTATLTKGNPVPAAFDQKMGVLTCTSSGTGDIGAETVGPLVASAGITYTATGWIYSPSVVVQAQIQVWFLDANGTILAQPSTALQSTTVGAWIGLAPLTATAPAGTATCVVIVVVHHPSNGNVHYIDGVQLFAQGATNGPEHWSAGGSGVGLVLGSQGVTLNHWPAAEVQIPATTTATLTSIANPLDLTQLGGNPNLAITLPNFLATAFTLSNVTLGLSSDGGATWTSVNFAQSTNAVISGNTFAMWPLSLFEGGTLDPTKVNGVRVVLPNTGSAISVLLMSIRLLDPNWVNKDIDIDNFNGALRQCVPLDGNPAEVAVPNNQVLPVLWHAASTPGVDDPRPINGTWAAVFNTGSQTGFDALALNLRGVNGTNETQLDLEGQIQAQLQGPQPGLAESVLIGRTVGDLDTKTMEALESESMKSLDSVGATVNQSWIRFQIAWGSTPGIMINRSAFGGVDYQWQGGALLFTDGTITFQNSTYYLMVVNLNDTTAQLQIYTLNQSTLAMGALLFDTGVIQDSYRFIRRQGRVGWKATLQDGDSFVHSVRPESQLFAEYRSAALNSNTPVAGVRVYTNTSADEQLWTSWSPVTGNGSTPTLTPDVRRTTSGQSTQVSVVNTGNGQGIISNILTPSDDPVSGITDWRATSVNFDLWFPSAALNAGGGLAPYLLSQDGNRVPLSMPRIEPDQWQSIQAFAPAGLQSGRYQLGLTFVGAPTTFWVDSVQVTQKAITWSARSGPGNAWVDLRDALSSDSAGALFTVRGTGLQVRAQALRQDAAVMGAPKIVPIYAPLGRLVWPEDAVVDTIQLTAPTPISVSASPTHGQPTTFSAQVVPTPAGSLINWFWSFGDGISTNGAVVRHTYASAGTYAVTLTVEDLYGVRTTYETSVGVL